MRRFTLAHYALAALEVFIVFQAVRYLRALPPRVASHFDMAGHANGWMTREMFVEVFVAVTGFLAAMPWVVDAVVRSVPVNMVNLPNREYWLAPERREDSLRRLNSALALFMFETAALLAAMTELAFRANLSGGSFNSSIAWPLMAAYGVATVAWLISMFRAFALPPSAAASPRR